MFRLIFAKCRAQINMNQVFVITILNVCVQGVSFHAHISGVRVLVCWCY